MARAVEQDLVETLTMQVGGTGAYGERNLPGSLPGGPRRHSRQCRAAGTDSVLDAALSVGRRAGTAPQLPRAPVLHACPASRWIYVPRVACAPCRCPPSGVPCLRRWRSAPSCVTWRRTCRASTRCSRLCRRPSCRRGQPWREQPGFGKGQVLFMYNTVRESWCERRPHDDVRDSSVGGRVAWRPLCEGCVTGGI